MSFATSTLLLAAKEETNNPILPNGTFIAELVGFLVLLYLLNRLVLPPLKKAMTDRQNFIERQIKDSEDAKERVEKAEADLKALMEKTRAESAQIRDEARAEGKAIIAELREKAQEEADRVRARGEEQLATEREQVVAALRGEIGKLASELAERIVGEQLSDDAAQKRVVDRFIADLEEHETEDAR